MEVHREIHEQRTYEPILNPTCELAEGSQRVSSSASRTREASRVVRAQKRSNQEDDTRARAIHLQPSSQPPCSEAHARCCRPPSTAEAGRCQALPHCEYDRGRSSQRARHHTGNAISHLTHLGWSPCRVRCRPRAFVWSALPSETVADRDFCRSRRDEREPKPSERGRQRTGSSPAARSHRDHIARASACPFPVESTGGSRGPNTVSSLQRGSGLLRERALARRCISTARPRKRTRPAASATEGQDNRCVERRLAGCAPSPPPLRVSAAVPRSRLVGSAVVVSVARGHPPFVRPRERRRQLTDERML
jgi:hypothetical protein